MLQPVREWCEPAELVREAVERAELQNEVKVSVAKDLPAIEVDAALIEQALTLLLSNAATYGSEREPIEMKAARDDSTLVLSVRDRGPGLAQGEETKVFEKFYRGARKRPGGLGLGLSIARQLVEAHGGKISARNRDDGGAEFSIRLPIGQPMRLPPEALV